jgi:hypothetical protein
MVAAVSQMKLVGIDPDEEQAEIDAEVAWRTELFAACRQAVKEMGGYEVVAAALDRRWGRQPDGKELGRSVSASLLRAALNDAERNYFRAEWLSYFKSKNADVARIMAAGVKPKKTAEELLVDLEAELREELSHKRVEQIVRRARAR